MGGGERKAEIMIEMKMTRLKAQLVTTLRDVVLKRRADYLL